jgi:hypothetical protein
MAITPARERVRKSRRRRRLGLRPVQVELSEQAIDFLLARKPELRQHMVQLQSGIGMRGGPDNPLGARAMYLWSGNKDTLYRIHGTNEPWTIGTNVSSWLHPPDERGHRRSLQPHADRRESHRVRDRQTGRCCAIRPASSTGDSSDPLDRKFAEE